MCDYCEPTEEQLLDWAVEEDAEDPGSYQLRHRDALAWIELKNHVENRGGRLEKSFDDHGGVTPAQWWTLFNIWDLTPEECFAPDWDATFEQKREVQDVQLLGGDTRPILTSHQIYLQLSAQSARSVQWIYENTSRGVVIGPGYFQTEPTVLRVPIRKSRLDSYGEKNDRYRLSVLSKHCPPVAGRFACWLPSLLGYQEGSL